MIVAHRGASAAAPENTLAAFNLAWQEQAVAIEGDFHLTADLRHYPSLAREWLHSVCGFPPRRDAVEKN